MLQAVITALPLLLIEIDEDGFIIEFNLDTTSSFDFNLNSFKNGHLSAFFPEHISNEIESVLFALKKGAQPPVVNYQIKQEREDRWFEARFVPANNKHCIVIVQDITRYKKSESKIQKQLDQMSALRAIDRAISSSVDLNLTLSILLTELVNQLQIDAACILLWNPDTERLKYVSGLGFQTSSLNNMNFRLGEGYAGMVALEGRIIKKEINSITDDDFLRSPAFKKEGFVSYFGIPLVAKGQVQGVLEIFHRSRLSPDPDWLSFLEMLAGQAAIAIENASLFRDLQQSNAELTSAYDATIEGWSRALEMRDHESEGHTHRVTEMTVKLARKIGIVAINPLHIRHGATLHDIGKMGIPDHILHKSGPLSENEWDIIRKHPQFASDLISPIEYLRPARDIPYYHHERWDGSGYPTGLQGEEIPIAARLFAIIDVYDALTSDRPYRPAWSHQDAISHIQEQAGKLFDPEIVPVFLDMINEEPLLV